MENRRGNRQKHGGHGNVKLLIIAAVCLIVLIAIIAVAVHVTHPKGEIKLNGGDVVTVEYGEEFTDPGASATLGKKPAEVSSSGEVNVNKLGEYKIEYYIPGREKIKTIRTVRVVDTKAPVITLKHQDGNVTLPGTEYKEEGFTAIDNCDGDLTDKVERKQEGDKIIYTVTDASGNRATAVRDVIYGDNVAPEITLSGDQEIKLNAGDKFKEPGFTATDNCNGDLTGKVKVSGLPNTNHAGTYTVTYTVTDSYGNKAEATRKVIVAPIRQPSHVDPEEKVIYLTFDDGPGKYTEKLLGILEKYNVKATFFVVNTGYVNLLPKIAEQGHAIGVHTLTHDYSKVYASEEAYFKDFNAMRNIIHDKTGIWTSILRFPGGSSNRVSTKYSKGIMTKLTKSVTDLGYQYFDWNVSSEDAGGAKTADEVFNNVIRGIGHRKYSVVLQHDIKGYSVDAVERIIIWGLKNGYTFETLTPSSPVCHHRINN